MISLKNSLILLGLLPLSGMAQQKITMTYPETKITDIKDTYFGTVVADPYRWLEDDRAEDTKAWVIEQNAVTRAYFSKIPYRNAIKEIGRAHV